MVTAVVQLTVERDKINTVAEQIAEMEHVSEVYSVGGKIDLIAVIRAKDNDALAELVTGHLLKVGGIKTSETFIAFKVYSRHDLESMFTIGYKE
ncbi:MAG: Lrp/AsnC ligand binding domain-containing protein [Candidatus Latescibacteria bacterium]|nr:Lrp/AsnC ligand binding domain-containing protein [Candidatus Latescibacterota bacterium]